MAKPRPKQLDPVRQLIVERAHEVGTDLKAISKALRKNESYMHTFITKGSPRKLDGDDRKALAEMLNIHESQLKAETLGRHVPAIISPSTIIQVAGEEFARLPVYDLRASAGRGSYIDQPEKPLGYQLFEMSWLRDRTRSGVDALAVIEVHGDSMETTLYSGDHVLIDTSRRALAQPGLFVLGLEGELIVKRVSMDFESKAVTVLSDNPKYPAQTINSPGRLSVIGRVIWLGRNVG